MPSIGSGRQSLSEPEPMKRPARPLFSILLLAAFAVALTCRTLSRSGFSPFDLDTRRLRLPHAPPPVINATIIRFAETDLGEPKFKQDTEQLLEGNIGSFSRYRTFATWRRSNRHQEIPARTSRGLPVTARSPLFYRYWLDFRRNLQKWNRNKRFQADIMLDLVRLLKHPLDRYRGFPISDQKYSTCAVVGNSGILLESDYGKLIDSHEVVIRLNNARIDGYEHKVGSKTSFSFVNSNILHLCARKIGCFCHPYGPDVPMIMYVCQAIHFLDYTLCNSSYKSPLLVTDPRFDVLSSRIVKYYSVKRFVETTGESLEQWNAKRDGRNFHYSSGMQAVMLALGVCDKVSVFGFGKSDSAKHHYHTNQKVELHLHDYEAEYDLYRDIVERPRAVPFVSDKFEFPPMVIYH